MRDMLPAKRGSKFDHRGKTGHRNFFDIFCHSLTHKYQLCSLQGMTFDSWGSRVVGFTFHIWNGTVCTEVGGCSAQVSSVQCPCKMAQIEMTCLYSTQQILFSDRNSISVGRIDWGGDFILLTVKNWLVGVGRGVHICWVGGSYGQEVNHEERTLTGGLAVRHQLRYNTLDL